MRLERLNAPAFQLPDLVAFNERVRERLDPWLGRRWVRRLAILFAQIEPKFPGRLCPVATAMAPPETY